MKQNNKPEIHPLIRQRWSPRAFKNEMVAEEKLMAVVEAGRWAASAFNEQPWRFVIGRRGDDNYQHILSSLVEWNQTWAGKAPILILNLAKQTFTHNGKANVTASYDLGQAVANMVLEAIHQGLDAHQMSGFDAQKAAKVLHIDDDFLPVSVTALGYSGKADDLPDDMAKMETKTRERKPIQNLFL